MDEKESMTIQTIIAQIEKRLPLRLQESWDNSGLQVGQTDIECSGVLTTLDITESVIEEAISLGCNLIVAHHPILFKGLKRISYSSYVERCVIMAIKHDITIYAAHTNADSAYMGLNYWLGQKMGLLSIETLSPTNGNSQEGLGVIGRLPDDLDFERFLGHIARIFKSKQLRHNGRTKDKIKTVAICGGAGAFLWERARDLGSDVLITGEAKYNDYFDAEGISLITVGHYESELPVAELFQQIISDCTSVPVYVTKIEHNPIITLD